MRKILSITENAIILSEDGTASPIPEPNSPKYVSVVSERNYLIVLEIIAPQKRFLLALLEDKSLGQDTIRYWEENWHDKLSKQIHELTKIPLYEVSVTLNAIFKY